MLAEVTGGPVTSNLNLHDRLTEYEIVCPGESGTLPEEFRISLDDLHLVHEAEQDRLVLRSTRLGCEVIPVYLGYLVPLALPELPRTLLMLSPTSMAPLNVWGGVPESEPTGGVSGRPRVRHGSVVLSRRSWSAPATVLPLYKPGARTTVGSWPGMRSGAPTGCPTGSSRPSRTAGREGHRREAAVPRLRQPLSLSAFEAIVKSPEARVVFREMLPDEDGLHTVSARGHHVAELAMETAGSVRRRNTP
ncbi:lantibiotic dehydratase [Streptomyces sp. M10(2022)]